MGWGVAKYGIMGREEEAKKAPSMDRPSLRLDKRTPHLWKNHPRLAFKSLRASVDDRDDRGPINHARRSAPFLVHVVDEPAEGLVQPPPRFNIVQARHHDRKLPIPLRRVVLELAKVRCHYAPRDAPVHECSRDHRFGLANILQEEKEVRRERVIFLGFCGGEEALDYTWHEIGA